MIMEEYQPAELMIMMYTAEEKTHREHQSYQSYNLLSSNNLPNCVMHDMNIFPAILIAL